ncbi:MAG: T9SS type A sorting domain-containing protein [Sphingobacteriales bacterium]|nr:MAG: T9SS type A sorting domain-containing protein [Sphingobacteriales bacterium]
MFTNLKYTILAVLLAAAATSAQTPGSLKASYPFSGNAIDSSGNNNNGQITGNVVLATDRFGQHDHAYLFPGNTNSYIEIPLSPDFSFTPAQAFSISLWYQGGSPNSGDMEYFWGDKANNSGYFFGLYDVNRVLFHECWAPMSSTTFPNPDTTWHHAVAVYDNGNYSLYRDNQLLASQSTATTPLSAPAHNIVIGHGFQGKIDDIRYYNEALDTAAITTLFQMTGSAQPTKISGLPQDLNVSIFPNPASDYLYVALKDQTSNVTISIFSVQGKLIKTIKSEQGQSVQLNIRDIPEGLYLVSISAGNNHQSRLLQKVK